MSKKLADVLPDTPRRTFYLLVALAVSLYVAGGARAMGKPEEPARVTRSAITSLKISYKLDPRLVEYMGVVWVSPPVYETIQPGPTFIQETKSEAVDTLGRKVPVNAEWIPDTPSMVSVTVSQKNEVTLTVHHIGQSTLQVVSGGLTKTLYIQAVLQNGAMRVQFALAPQPPLPSLSLRAVIPVVIR